MDIEKLKQIKMLVDECIQEYQGEEDSEVDIEESDMPESPSSMGGGDKIKMAVAAMRRGK